MLIKLRASHVDFLNFDFSIGMARIGQLCLRLSRAFCGLSLERRESRNSSAHGFLSNTVSPGFVIEHSNRSQMANVRILGKLKGESPTSWLGEKNRRLKRVLPEWGKCRCMEKTRLWDNWYVLERKFAIVQVDLIDTTITPKFRNANTG